MVTAGAAVSREDVNRVRKKVRKEERRGDWVHSTPTHTHTHGHRIEGGSFHIFKGRGLKKSQNFKALLPRSFFKSFGIEKNQVCL